jgi:hypothetical protein
MSYRLVRFSDVQLSEKDAGFEARIRASMLDRLAGIIGTVTSREATV